MDNAVPRLTRADAKRRTYRRLLDTARATLMRHGYQGATLDRIAADAGNTKGAIYGHFKSKEELFLHLLSEGLDQSIAEMESNLQVGRHTPERLGEVVDRFIERQKGDFVPLLALELEQEGRSNAALAGELRRLTNDYHRAMTSILERYYVLLGQEPPMPCGELAATLMIFSQGYAMARQSRPHPGLDYSVAVRLLLGIDARG